MVNLEYLIKSNWDKLQRWAFDLPKIGQRLRFLKYRNVFNLYDGEVAIDLGANIGKVTNRIAKAGVKVYAYEPDPNAFAELSKNMSNRNGVFLINKAVSDHNSRAKIYFDKRHNEDPLMWSIRSSLLIDKPFMSKDHFAEVEVVDIADILNSIKEPIGLVKMDIEGEEVKVLNRMIDLGLDKKVRKIVVETHERFPTLTESTKQLRLRILREGIKNIDLDWA